MGYSDALMRSNAWRAQKGYTPSVGTINPDWSIYFDNINEGAEKQGKALRYRAEGSTPSLDQLPGYQENAQAAMPLSLRGMAASNQIGPPTLRKKRF